MSKDCKVALGIDSFDYAELKDLIKNLSPDYSGVVSTIDCSYLIFYWDWTCWDGEYVNALLKKLEHTRHSLIEIGEDGFYTDIETCDIRGTDEEFYELLSWNVNIKVWDEFDLCPQEPDDWKISLEELNRVIGDLEMEAVLDQNRIISIKDLQNTHALEGEYFKAPQDVINRLVGSYLDDIYLNGEICCDNDENFSSYQEAELTARKKGYTDEADRIQIILKAMDLEPFEKEPLVIIKGEGGVNGHLYYESGQILVNGKNVLTGYMTPYPMRLETDNYIFAGIHGENPGCYEYLDRLLIVRKSDGSYKILSLWDVIGNRFCKKDSALRSICLDKNGNVIIASNIKRAMVLTDHIFAEDVKPDTRIIRGGDTKQLENCFEYTVLEDYGVIIKLKKEIPKSHLLNFHGFDITYDTFKLWDLNNDTSYLCFIDSDKGNSWTVNWGNSTSVVSGHIWQQRDELLRCLEIVIPNHPAYREKLYYKKI